jgi:hypothetical protein
VVKSNGTKSYTFSCVYADRLTEDEGNKLVIQTDGINVIEVMLLGSSIDKHYYNIRSVTPYKWTWGCGTTIKEVVKGGFDFDFSDECIPPYKKYPEIKKQVEDYLRGPLYLEEDLVPSQYFGLVDYLKCRT